MTRERPPDLDRRLRNAFPRDTHAVARVVRGALAADPRRPLRWRMALGVGVAAALIAVVSTVWPVRPAPGSLEVMPLSGSLSDGLLVISLPDGSVSISNEGIRDSRPPDGYGIVLVEGDSQMTRPIRMATLVLLAGTVAGSALAQDNLGKRVSLDLKGMAPTEAFKVLADAVGLTVTVDQAVTAPVDILVRNVTAKTALTTICESIGCRWTVTGGALVVKPALAVAVDVVEGTAAKKAKPVSDPNFRVQKNAKSVERIRVVLSQQLPADMKFENAPLSVVSERLSAALGLQVTISNADPAVQTLTADLSNQTLQSGLSVLAKQAGDSRPWRLGITAPTAEGAQGPSIHIMLGGPKTVVVKKK